MKADILMLDFEQKPYKPVHTSGFVTHDTGAAFPSKTWNRQWGKYTLIG